MDDESLEMKRAEGPSPRWCGCDAQESRFVQGHTQTLALCITPKKKKKKPASIFFNRRVMITALEMTWAMPTWIQVPLLERLRRARAIAMTTDYRTNAKRKATLCGVTRDEGLRQETPCNIHVPGLRLNREQRELSSGEPSSRIALFRETPTRERPRPNPRPSKPQSAEICK